MDALLSPVILFFVLGAVAALVRSDLSIPEPIAKGMAIYLMAAIGLKGGVEVAASGFTPAMAMVAAAGLVFSFLVPIPAFLLLRSFGRLDRVNAAAIAAHYGSVSVVTFVTGIEVVRAAGLAPAGYMVAVLALMETPAIITGLLLARQGAPAAPALQTRQSLWHETLFNGSVMLLVGAFLIGLVAGKQGFAPIAPFFDTGFRGVLCLFLLDMGLLAARRLREARSLTPRLIALAILLPLCNGLLGNLAGWMMGLDPGTAAAFAILTASASYIAVPAAMRLALPQADPGLYLAMSLAVTFPFNIAIGIPLYMGVARTLGGA